VNAKSLVLFPMVLAAVVAQCWAADNTKIDLTPRIQPGTITRVSVELEAGGSTLVRTENIETPTAGKEQRLPMSVSAKMDYTERTTSADSPLFNGTSGIAIRHYDVAEAVIKVDQSGAEPRLPDDRRLIVVENAGARPGMYCPHGSLTREQLDLVDTVGNSCIIDELLPEKPVADGETWTSAPTAMAALLTLDSVAVCEVQSVLEEFNVSFAKVRLAGVVHGTADGAATEQDVRGVYLFDRRLRRITRLNLAVREQRSIGNATPGLDAVAKVQIKIEPAQSAAHLSDDALTAIHPKQRAPRDLAYESPAMGFRIHYDRNWFITAKQRESVTLRRIDGSDLAAQCTLTMLAPKSAGRQTTLEQFQKDVVYSLGKGFGELVSTRQWQNSHSHYCYEVVARGHVDEVPVEWHYYLVAREAGHRISAAVTIEAPMVDRVAAIDRQLIQALELFPQLPAAQTAENASDISVR
jgi:hypothetical protein